MDTDPELVLGSCDMEEVPCDAFFCTFRTDFLCSKMFQVSGQCGKGHRTLAPVARTQLSVLFMWIMRHRMARTFAAFFCWVVGLLRQDTMQQDDATSPSRKKSLGQTWRETLYVHGLPSNVCDCCALTGSPARNCGKFNLPIFWHLPLAAAELGTALLHMVQDREFPYSPRGPEVPRHDVENAWTRSIMGHHGASRSISDPCKVHDDFEGTLRNYHEEIRCTGRPSSPDCGWTYWQQRQLGAWAVRGVPDILCIP